jgi:PAS domain S-box-containing protein
MLILASGLSVSLVALTSYLTIRSNLVSSVGSNLKAHAQDRAREVGSLLSQQFDALESLALSKQIQGQATVASAAYPVDYLPAIRDQLKERDLAWQAAGDDDPVVQDILNNDVSHDLREFQQHFVAYSTLLVTDKRGAVLAATNRPTTYDQSTQTWWWPAFNQGQGALYISQPLFDPGTQLRHLIIVVPIYNHLHTLVGMLEAMYSFKEVEQLMATDGLGQRSHDSLLLPSDQMLISGSQFAFLEPNVVDKLQATTADFAMMNFEGQSQLVSYAKVTSFDPKDTAAFDSLDWTLIVSQKAAEAFAPLNATWKATILSTLTVLLLSAGIAIVLAQVLMAPITRLTTLARQIESGDLSTKAQIESRDEIGTLASALNGMLEALSRTQRELQESGELYRSLVDYSPDMIAVHRHGRYVFVNPAGVRLLGAQSANELIGRSIFDVIPAADHESVKKGIEQTQRVAEPTPLLEQTIQRLDGNIIQVELIGIPILYEGQPAIQTVMRGITERKRLEEQWQKFKLGIEHSTDAMFMTDMDGTIRYVNPAFEKLYGYFWDEAIGHTPRILKSGTLSQETYENFWEMLLAKRTVAGQIVNRTKDGTLLNIEGSNNPILDEHGNLIGFLGVHRDVSERKRAEDKIHQLLAQLARQRDNLELRVAERTEELNRLNQRLQNELIERQGLMVSLRDSEERFRLLFEASPDAILLIDPHDPNNSWPIIDCNEVACQMNGYTREEMIGQSIDLLNKTPGDLTERKEYLDFLRHEGVLHRDGVHRHKDGHLFPIEVSSSLVNFGGRELVLGIDRNITERKQAELALQQAKDAAEDSRHLAEAASRAKSEFLSRMSHELRTPMNAILGFAQLLEMSRKESLTSTQKERVRQIVKGGQHLLDLINEILDISRIEANRLQISPEPVSIRASIQEVLDLTTSLAVERHIQVVTKWSNLNDNPFVMADRQRLKQVLLNLLGNAVKYNYEGGSVIITCLSMPGDTWRISIADTGPGITQENLARLFVPFERLDTDQSSHVEGTGLGLVLAKRLVELMRGQIGVESIPGKGSTFWVELPATESPVEHFERTGSTGRLPMMSSRARKVLYVEDNVANFELIQEVLADHSQIRLLWASDARSGVEMVRERQPDLVLLDLHLGAVDGAEVLRRLKQDEKTAGIPVVVISADATSHQIERLTSLGAKAYLTKPLNVQHFVLLMEELLSEKAT